MEIIENFHNELRHLKVKIKPLFDFCGFTGVIKALPYVLNFIEKVFYIDNSKTNHMPAR
jgi:hypothetical protein